MKSYKVGVIGYGWAATAHIDAINATNQGAVAAVYSSRPLDSEELSARHGSKIRAYQSLDEMLASDIDIVSITSYPSQHREHVEAAARAGKNIILEKPMAMNWEDSKAIAKAVREAGVKVSFCFELRYVSQFVTTAKLLRDGLIGSIHYGEVNYYHGVGPWYGQYRWNTTLADGGSSLISAGCHALDILLMCMGSKVEEVTTYATQSKNEIFQKYEYPTTTVSILKFENGTVGKVASVIDCMQPYYFHTQLVGSEGSMLDNKVYSTKFALRDKKWTELPMALADSGDVADHPYKEQFQAFFDSLDGREGMPVVGIEEALESFRVIYACDLSAAENRPIKMSELS